MSGALRGTVKASAKWLCRPQRGSACAVPPRVLPGAGSVAGAAGQGGRPGVASCVVAADARTVPGACVPKGGLIATAHVESGAGWGARRFRA